LRKTPRLGTAVNHEFAIRPSAAEFVIALGRTPKRTRRLGISCSSRSRCDRRSVPGDRDIRTASRSAALGRHRSRDRGTRVCGRADRVRTVLTKKTYERVNAKRILPATMQSPGQTHIWADHQRDRNMSYYVLSLHLGESMRFCGCGCCCPAPRSVRASAMFASSSSVIELSKRSAAARAADERLLDDTRMSRFSTCTVSDAV